MCQHVVNCSCVPWDIVHNVAFNRRCSPLRWANTVMKMVFVSPGAVGGLGNAKTPLLRARSRPFVFPKYSSTVYVCGVSVKLSLCPLPAEVSGQGVNAFCFFSFLVFDWGLSSFLRRKRSNLCLFKRAVTFVTIRTNTLLANATKRSLRSVSEKVKLFYTWGILMMLEAAPWSDYSEVCGWSCGKSEAAPIVIYLLLLY